ncbi:MAG: hypothetical protein HDR09_14465 [Lachnospiraceae bacterium]|nr:hypothetical protein [Lachnospiraceae bacterium]
MKKRTINRILAACLTMAIVLGGTPAITAKADLKVPGGDPADDGAGGFDIDIPGSGETTEDLGRTEGNQFNSGSSNGSGSASGSSSDSYSGSYDSYEAPSSDAGGSDGGSGTQSAGTASTGLTSSGNTVKISSYETWRREASAVSGTFTVYHKGIKQYTLQLKDGDGNAVSYKNAGIIQSEDGKYYINIVTSGGVDTTGWTAVTLKGTSTYLPKLGVSGVCINGTVVVEADTAAAAE